MLIEAFEVMYKKHNYNYLEYGNIEYKLILDKFQMKNMNKARVTMSELDVWIGPCLCI